MIKRYLCFACLLPFILAHASGASLVGKTFELRQPLFFYYSTVLNSYVLEPPGFSIRVPKSIALFDQYGETWRMHDRRLLSRHRSVVPHELMETVPIGAHFFIESMKIEAAVMFDVWVASGRIDDPRFAEFTVRLAGLLWDTSTDEPRVDTEYLIPVADD